MMSNAAAPASAWSALPLRLLNLLAFVPLMVGNAMAGSGQLSGESIGLIANRWPTLLLPANWAFAIWSLIYLGLALFVVYQALPREDARRTAARVGPLWLTTVVLNLAWITAFSFSWFGISLCVMAALLIALIAIYRRVGPGHAPGTRMERVFVQAPFSLYLGWIVVATVVNSSQYLSYLGWDGSPPSPVFWAIVAMAVVATGAALFDVLWGDWIIPLVATWALVAIAARYPDRVALAATAWTMAGFCALLPLVLRVWRSAVRRRMAGAAPP
jgi:hypothetical protein